MGHPDIHTATGAYAANALPPEEREEAERHLAVCAACAEEVRELQAALGRLAQAAAAPAPAALRDRVLAEVSRTRQLPPVTELDSARRRFRPSSWARSPFAVAAALLLVVTLGLGALLVQRQHELDGRRQLESQIASVLTASDKVVATANLDSGGRGTAVAAGGRAVFLASDLPPVASDRTYQLWVMTQNGIRSAGLLGRGQSAELFVPAVQAEDALAVTVEPAGGSPRPTSSPLVRLPLSR